MAACNNCGATNPDGACFCHNCGNNLSQEYKPDKERNDSVCPFCQTSNCQPILKSTTEVKHSGYHWDSGCCGMFLLGPFGLLCGLCGTGSESKTTHESWWSCTQCGKEHIALPDALKKWELQTSASLAASFVIGIVTLILKWLFEWSTLSSVFLIAVAVCILHGANTETKTHISEQLGEPLNSYLTKEQLDGEKKMPWIALGIALAVFFFAGPVLSTILKSL